MGERSYRLFEDGQSVIAGICVPADTAESLLGAWLGVRVEVAADEILADWHEFIDSPTQPDATLAELLCDWLESWSVTVSGIVDPRDEPSAETVPETADGAQLNPEPWARTFGVDVTDVFAVRVDRDWAERVRRESEDWRESHAELVERFWAERASEHDQAQP